MAEAATPVAIGRPKVPGGDLSKTLGASAADVLRLHIAVIDREDRLESGTGEWLSAFSGDAATRKKAAVESVLRALRMASDSSNYAILRTLTDGVGTPIEELVAVTGLSRPALAERLGDLVSAGLAAKIPEANQIAGVPAGAAIVEVVTAAAEHASSTLARDA